MGSDEAVSGRRDGNFRTGLLPGLQAGLLMAVVLMILSWGRGRQPFLHFELLAATLRQPADRPLGAGAIVAGHLVHFGLSALAGMLFTRVVGRTTRSRALGLGLLYGVSLWALTELFFLPVLNPAMALRQEIVWPWFLGYLAYGSLLASLVPVRGEIDEEPPARSSERATSGTAR